MNEMDYSIIIPVYKSEASLEELCSRINNTLSNLDCEYEIILVDDCSPDKSWDVMKRLQANDPRIKLIQLMKNSGQHNALMCGFNNASGKYVITMDDDLQNPPEEMPKLINKITQEDYDCVIGALEVKQDTLIKKAGSLFIRYLNTAIFNKPKDLKLSSFRIMTREIAEKIAAIKTPYPYISGMLLTLTTNIANVTVKHDKRKFGQSNYNLSKLLFLSFNLIINYSSLPLRILTFTGFCISCLSFLFGAYSIFKKLFYHISVPGWTTTIVLISFFNGLLLIILAVMGEYMSRIITEVSKHPQYIIRKKIT